MLYFLGSFKPEPQSSLAYSSIIRRPILLSNIPSIVALKALVCSVALVSVCNANAAGQVNSLEIKDNVVVFSTEEVKTATIPPCSYPVHSQKWAFSIDSTEGRNLYSSLLTANSVGLAVTVESAQDCRDSAGIERPASISIVKESS